METYIRINEKDTIGTIRIENPPVNSLSSEVLSALGRFLDKFLSDISIRAVIITGGGEKIFASGANIKELADLDKAGGLRVASRVKEVFAKVWLSPKPVFCAINGHALGGGLELALHCDFRVSTEEARFGQPEINLGVLPGAGGTQLLPRLIGLPKARWLLLSGETISAREALEFGLVDRVVKAGVLLGETEEMAHRIVEKPPLAIQSIKNALRLLQSPGLEEAMNEETEMFGKLCATEDKKEGVLAFLQKRKGRFEGR